jgi:imidazolonepropionase-like amidohydrolase
MSEIPASLVIKNGTVVDGTGASPVPGAMVGINGNRIVAVGRSTDLTISPKAAVIDAREGTILPGIIDSHVHTTSAPAVRRSILLGGITSTCDLGSAKNAMPQFEQDYLDQEPVARGFRAGPILTAPGGLPDALFRAAVTSVLTRLWESLFPNWTEKARKRELLAKVGRWLSKVAKPAKAVHAGLNYEVANPEEAQAAVTDLLNQGADVIKIFLHQKANGRAYPILSQETVQALVQAAHSHGVPVRAHVWEIPPADIALAGGVDVIEHVPKTTISPAEMKEITASRDPLSAARQIIAPQMEARDRQLERMVAQGIVLVPTLARYRWDLDQASVSEPEAEFKFDLDVAGVRRFHDLGGVVALGTDYNSGLDEKKMVLDELAFLVQAGLTPMEAIEAATRHAARVCGHGDELGTLQPDKLADVIVVDGDPLQDIRAIGNVSAVIKDGEIAYASE